MRSPYDIIHSRRVTEKSRVLGGLHQADSNPSLKKCQTPKVVFDVDPRANKQEIAKAVEEIYKEKNVRVVSVNTVTVPSKPRRIRGHWGKTSVGKKAIVTFRAGDVIEDAV